LTAIGWDEVKIILIESFPCDNKMELEKRERYYIDQLSPSLNSSRPCLTEAEHKQNKLLQDQKYRMVDYLCDVCGTTCKRNAKAKHFKSIKHLQNLEKQKQLLEAKE